MSDSKNESEITVEEALEEGEVYMMSNDATRIPLSKVDKPNPLICPICKGPFMNAMSDNCNHYFYHICAQYHYENNKNWFVCDEETLGVFNHTMKLFICEPVEPTQMAEERETAKVKKTMVLEMLNDSLKMANGSKRKMVSGMLKEALKKTNESKRKLVNVEKAVKIANEVETLLKRAIQKATKARETEIGEFIMFEEMMATLEKSTVNMERAFELMINLY